MRRKHEDFHDGAKDGLTPLAPLDLNKIEDFDQLLKAMGQTAFGGRSLGEAADVLEAMLRDPDCTVVGTFSGAMSVAKMGLLICDMIDRGWLKAIVTTGALIAHGFIETLGRVHYKYPENLSDRELFVKGYNRIYDTLEIDPNFTYTWWPQVPAGTKKATGILRFAGVTTFRRVQRWSQLRCTLRSCLLISFAPRAAFSLKD